MPKKIWEQVSTDLLDTPLAEDGSIYGEPGETLVVNAARTGVEWKQAGGAGSVGPANSLSIGTVVGGPTAAASITGAPPSQTLNLTLPKGDTGSPGIQGPAGSQGPQGATGPQGPIGSGTTPNEYGNLTEAKITQIQTADVNWIFIVNPNGDLRVNPTLPASLNGNMSGHMIRYDGTTNAWTDFGQWTGLPGAQGPAGVTGPAGPTGATGPAGANGTNGTNGAQGATGPTGATGATGPAGPKYIASYAAIVNQTISFADGQPDMVSRTVIGAASWTFSSPPAADIVACRFLELTNGGLGTQTWPVAVKWEDGVAPELTAAGMDILAFYTRDGGVTYRGVMLVKDSK